MLFTGRKNLFQRLNKVFCFPSQLGKKVEKVQKIRSQPVLKSSTQMLEDTFFPVFLVEFLSFFIILPYACDRKTWKSAPKDNFDQQRLAKHPFAGRNTQHMIQSF